MKEKHGDHKHEITPWIHFVAGGVAGSIAALCTGPLDVVRTRQQSSSLHQYKYPFGTATVLNIRDIMKAEGIKGLWRGILPTLVGVTPTRAIQFSVYSTSKEIFTTQFGVHDGTMLHLLCATAGGTTAIFLTAPIWFVKTRLQLQTGRGGHHGAAAAPQLNDRPYKGVLDCIVRVYREEGMRTFYKGLGASFVGVVETAIQFALYEGLKKQVKPYFEKHPELKQFEYMTAAGIAKLIASVATYPHEVVRTRMRERDPVLQKKYSSLWRTIAVVAKEEGVIGLYGGMGAHLMRVIPNAAIMFYTYEVVVKTLTARKQS